MSLDREPAAPAVREARKARSAAANLGIGERFLGELQLRLSVSFNHPQNYPLSTRSHLSFSITTMAPNQRIVSGRPQKGFFRNAYDEVTNPEHATIVRSILVFGVCPLLSFFAICKT